MLLDTRELPSQFLKDRHGLTIVCFRFGKPLTAFEQAAQRVPAATQLFLVILLGWLVGNQRLEQPQRLRASLFCSLGLPSLREHDTQLTLD
ncbi:MAG TPA: hypothetical protein VK395_04650 [Gemmataceae bacterium]|nr:hypothetical protein [Gemmataceae bacterium]